MAVGSVEYYKTLLFFIEIFRINELYMNIWDDESGSGAHFLGSVNLKKLDEQSRVDLD